MDNKKKKVSMWVLVNSQVVKFMHLDSIESDNEDDIENAMID